MSVETGSVGKAWRSVAPIWLLGALGIVVVAVVDAEHRLAGIGLTLAVCTVTTLVVQLATRRKEGFVDRITMSVIGAVVLLAVATVVFALVAASTGAALVTG
ncbi:hypothetical protein [Luethyella okanaganae]|uniref:Uncharacterized protein n=1 Tax=Luethyella okanaganae TaxID=69372 RepID=A0ABW1VJ30_9MICO